MPASASLRISIDVSLIFPSFQKLTKISGDFNADNWRLIVAREYPVSFAVLLLESSILPEMI